MFTQSMAGAQYLLALLALGCGLCRQESIAQPAPVLPAADGALSASVSSSGFTDMPMPVAATSAPQSNRRTAPIDPVQTTVSVDASADELRSGANASYRITQSDVLSAAGTWQDFTRYLRLIPGVVWNSDLSNDVIVRGGHPSENLYVIDGIETPNINHISFEGSTGGFTSMLDTSLVGGIDMKAGVYDTRYSSRLSSLIDIQTRTPQPDKLHRELTVGISGIGGLAELPIAKTGKESIVLSAHRSILNWFTNDIGINGVPIYTDGLATVHLSPTERSRFSFLSLSGADSLNMVPNPCDDGVTSILQMEYGGSRSTNGFTWQHIDSPRIVSTLTASFSHQAQNIDQQQQQLSGQFGSWQSCVSTPYRKNPLYSEQTSDGISNLEYRMQFGGRAWAASVGETGRIAHYRYTVAQPMGQQSPFSADANWTDADSFARDIFAGESASYAEVTAHVRDRLSALAGARLETFALTGAHMLSPRGSLSYRLNQHQGLDVEFGRAAQLAPTIDILSYSQNAHLLPIAVDQFSAGAQLWHADRWSIDLQAYHKVYLHEPASTEYPALMLANMVDTLGQQFVWLPLNSKGRGRAEGIEMLVRAHRARFQMMASTTCGRTWYAAADGAMRRGNYDIPFVSNIAGGVRLRTRLELSLRNTLASGRPFTPFDIALSEQQSRGIYDLTRVNALRGPVYNRLDIDLHRTFTLRRGLLDVYGGVENALNRENFLGYAWEASCAPPYDQCGLNKSAFPGVPETMLTQMPLFPSAGARFAF